MDQCFLLWPNQKTLCCLILPHTHTHTTSFRKLVLQYKIQWEWKASLINYNSTAVNSVNYLSYREILGFPGGSDGKESTCKVGDLGLIPGLGRCPWRRERRPTPVFLPGEFHGQRSLAGYSPWSCKELDMTEWLSLTHSLTHSEILLWTSSLLLTYPRQPLTTSHPPFLYVRPTALPMTLIRRSWPQ